MHASIQQSIRLSIQLSIHPFKYPFLHLCIQLSIHPFNYPSLHLSIQLSVHPFNYPSLSLSIQLFVLPSIHPFNNPSNYLSIHPSIHPSIIHQRVFCLFVFFLSFLPFFDLLTCQQIHPSIIPPAHLSFCPSANHWMNKPITQSIITMNIAREVHLTYSYNVITTTYDWQCWRKGEGGCGWVGVGGEGGGASMICTWCAPDLTTTYDSRCDAPVLFIPTLLKGSRIFDLMNFCTCIRKDTDKGYCDIILAMNNNHTYIFYSAIPRWASSTHLRLILMTIFSSLKTNEWIL